MSAETSRGWNKSHGGLGQMERMRKENLDYQIRCHLGVILPVTASDQGSKVSFKNLALLLIPFPPWSRTRYQVDVRTLPSYNSKCPFPRLLTPGVQVCIRRHWVCGKKCLHNVTL